MQERRVRENIGAQLCTIPNQSVDFT